MKFGFIWDSFEQSLRSNPLAKEQPAARTENFNPFKQEAKGRMEESIRTMVPEDDFKVVAYEQEWNEESKLLAYYIRREDMEIKDVVMKHVLPFHPGKSLMKFMAMSNEWIHWIASPLVAYQQSISFHKLSVYFFQNVDVDFQSDPNFLSLEHSANGVPHPSLGFLPERINRKLSLFVLYIFLKWMITRKT
ncbi:hypothetical protein H5410_046799 [Solanum commersonii]|uniref:Uncharacterized protein n=1 Tax=Solanum commersonii TaxID=4109 RepID=A0A9J5XFA5_SOLCO|nr:hypothetical protein H5410_046799 [Solanum commersonii]